MDSGLVSPQRLKKRPMLVHCDAGEVYRSAGDSRRSVSVSPRSNGEGATALHGTTKDQNEVFYQHTGGISMEAPLQDDSAWNLFLRNLDSAEDSIESLASPTFKFYEEKEKKKSFSGSHQTGGRATNQTSPPQQVRGSGTNPVMGINFMPPGRISNIQASTQGLANIRAEYRGLGSQPPTIGVSSRRYAEEEARAQLAAEQSRRKVQSSTLGTNKSPHHAARVSDQRAMQAAGATNAAPTRLKSPSDKKKTYTLEEEFYTPSTTKRSSQYEYETPYGSPVNRASTPVTQPRMSPASQAKKEFQDKQAKKYAETATTTYSGTSSSASSMDGRRTYASTTSSQQFETSSQLRHSASGLAMAQQATSNKSQLVHQQREAMRNHDNERDAAPANNASSSYNSYQNPCSLAVKYGREIADRPDELPMEPVVEYYMENLDVHPKPVGPGKDGRMVQHPPYKIKILSVEILPSSIYPPLSSSEIVQRDLISTNDIMNSPKHTSGRALHSHLQAKMEEKLANSPTGGHRGSAFRGRIESEFGAVDGKKFFLKMKPARYAGHGKSSFHWQNSSSFATWWRKKLCGKLKEDGIYCPEIPALGSNPLGRISDNMLASKDAFKKLNLSNPLGMPASKLNALALHEATGPDRPHMGIATLFKGMIVPNPLETYQQPGTFGNSRDPRAISEQANMTSPLHGIPRVKVPICCKRKLCPDKDHHLRQMVINLQSVLQLIYDFTGYGFDFMIDNTLAFCACSTTREKEEGVSYPMIMINLQRIPCKFSVLAHIVGHEYGHVMRGHLQQQCRCQHGPNSWQHKMLEYEADQFSALFIATMNIDPRDIYHHLANDEVRLSQLKHFVNTFSTHREVKHGDKTSPVKRLIRMLTKNEDSTSDSQAEA